MAKNRNTGEGPILENKKGIKEGIIAAKTQWTEVPKACPAPRSLLGNTSDIKTQITEPCPIAWEAINAKRKIGIK
ncbi:MAG: hypothetical protein RJA52_1280 [Bacteroidota bacterium]